jgi:IS5 family transposase
MTPLLLL